MTKDTFINLNLLYEAIDGPLEEIHTKGFWAKRWLEPCPENEWVPKRVAANIERSMEESEKAMELIREIQEIISEFKGKIRRKPAKVPQQKNRITHLNVVKGALYSPPQVVDNDFLSDKFKAWRQEQKTQNREVPA
ncbi:MAG: hypothetical protein NTV58_06635 [Deltaproteobacteria bacterium]|nr:hypothetical protein [Deltaproteobacteria bacterium]